MQSIETLEERLGNIEKTLNLILSEIADINMRLDIRDKQVAPKAKVSPKPKSVSKSKTKKEPPADIIGSLLEKEGPKSRMEIAALTDLNMASVTKAIRWMSRNALVEKDAQNQDAKGNSRWCAIDLHKAVRIFKDDPEIRTRILDCLGRTSEERSTKIIAKECDITLNQASQTISELMSIGEVILFKDGYQLKTYKPMDNPSLRMALFKVLESEGPKSETELKALVTLSGPLGEFQDAISKLMNTAIGKDTENTDADGNPRYYARDPSQWKPVLPPDQLPEFKGNDSEVYEALKELLSDGTGKTLDEIKQDLKEFGICVSNKQIWRLSKRLKTNNHPIRDLRAYFLEETT